MLKIPEIQIGFEYYMSFPFHRIGGLGSGFSESWFAGCEMHEEDDGGPVLSRYFTAHGEGKVIYKVLSVAEMPGKYLDRVIFKRWLIDPDGKKYNAGEVRMLTERAFYKDINSRTPFRADYELED